MTLQELLTEKLSRIQLSELGTRIAQKYRSQQKKNPNRKTIVVTAEIEVNDYPDEWMKVHGQKVIDNFLAVRVNG